MEVLLITAAIITLIVALIQVIIWSPTICRVLNIWPKVQDFLPELTVGGKLSLLTFNFSETYFSYVRSLS
jgi:hypothetical protein